MKKFSDFLVTESRKEYLDNRNPVIALIIEGATKAKVFNPMIDAYTVESFKEESLKSIGSFITANIGNFSLSQTYNFVINMFVGGDRVAEVSGNISLTVGYPKNHVKSLESNKHLTATWNDLKNGKKTSISANL